MQELYTENLSEILRNKKLLEKELNITITNKGKNIFINGNPENEFNALEIFKAINLGFSAEHALQLKDENIVLQIINIRDITKRHDLERIRARIIGTKGKTLRTLSCLTKCNLSIKDNRIGIIGNFQEINDASQAIASIIIGSKQGNVYERLEKQRKKKRIENKNLGINLMAKDEYIASPK